MVKILHLMAAVFGLGQAAITRFGIPSQITPGTTVQMKIEHDGSTRLFNTVAMSFGAVPCGAPPNYGNTNGLGSLISSVFLEGKLGTTPGNITVDFAIPSSFSYYLPQNGVVGPAILTGMILQYNSGNSYTGEYPGVLNTTSQFVVVPVRTTTSQTYTWSRYLSITNQNPCNL